MNRPPVKTRHYIEWNDLQDCVEQLLSERQGRQVKLRDYAGKHSAMRYSKWCDQQGYGKFDSEGKDRSSSQIWYAQYQADPEGAAKELPYLDFWHWWLMFGEPEVYNGLVSHFCFNIVLEDLISDEAFDDDSWQKEIFDAIGEVLTEEQKTQGIYIHYSW